MDEYQTIVGLKKPELTEGFQINDTFLLINSYLMQSPDVGPVNMDNWRYHAEKPLMHPARINRYLNLLVGGNIIQEKIFRGINLENHFQRLTDLGLIEVADFRECDEGPEEEFYDLKIDRELSQRVFNEIEQLKTQNVPSEILINFREFNPFYRKANGIHKGDNSFYERLRPTKE
jgi:hypothetical protein